MANILIVVTSHDRLGDTGMGTGSWLEELASPYYVFRDAGHDVSIASPKGGAAPIDEISSQDPWISDAGRRFLADEAALAAMQATRAVSDVDAAGVDAVFLAGGAGAAWDFPASTALAELIEAVAGHDGVVAAICHGALGLAGARKPDGAPFVAGRRVTGVSLEEQQAANYDKIVPFIPQQRLSELGGEYLVQPPFSANVVRDGRLVTGQNPASAPALAQAVHELVTA